MTYKHIFSVPDLNFIRVASLKNTPVSKYPQPNFKSHHSAFLDIHREEKNFKMCFRWRRILCGWCFGVQSYLKGLWHASAHVQHLDLWSGEPFFKIGFWWKKSSSIDSETLLYQYSRDILYILEFLNVKLCIFVQALSKKFQVMRRSARRHIICCQCVPTNGSNVAFNGVIWLFFLSIKFSSQRSTFFG